MNGKVALLLHSLVGGGAQRSVMQIASGLRDAGCTVHLVVLQSERQEVPVPDGITLHFLARHRKITGYKLIDRHILARRLKKLIAELEQDGRFDLIISNMSTTDHLVRIARIPDVYATLRGVASAGIAERRGALRKLLAKFELRKLYRNRNIIAVSRGVAEDATEVVGISPASLRVIYNPFPVSHLRERSMEQCDTPAEPYILHVGAFRPGKRHDLLIRAFHAAQLPHRLVLLGSGTAAEEASVRSVIAELDLHERVTLAGWHENPYPWIRKADLLVLTSDHEGLPRVLVEAVAIGTKVVSTNCVAGPSEILTGELAPFLTPVGEVAPLADAMRRAVASDIRPTTEMVTQFTPETVIRQYLSLPTRTGRLLG